MSYAFLRDPNLRIETKFVIISRYITLHFVPRMQYTGCLTIYCQLFLRRMRVCYLPNQFSRWSAIPTYVFRHSNSIHTLIRHSSLLLRHSNFVPGIFWTVLGPFLVTLFVSTYNFGFTHFLGRPTFAQQIAETG
jgi:hypothetical protein